MKRCCNCLPFARGAYFSHFQPRFHVFIFHSAVQEFRTKYKLVLAEMRVLANESNFAEWFDSQCEQSLNNYIEHTNRFMELLRLASLEEFTRDAQNISRAIDDFLSFPYSVSNLKLGAIVFVWLRTF